MSEDRLGRRRSPDQGRGLRPLHPLLPVEWMSKAVRIAMSEADWSRFEALTEVWGAVEPVPSQPRAYGQTLSRLIQHAEQSSPAALDWMDWERQKTLKLLRYAV